MRTFVKCFSEACSFMLRGCVYFAEKTIVRDEYGILTKHKLLR